jgi:hypothetical protein
MTYLILMSAFLVIALSAYVYCEYKASRIHAESAVATEKFFEELHERSRVVYCGDLWKRGKHSHTYLRYLPDPCKPDHDLKVSIEQCSQLAVHFFADDKGILGYCSKHVPKCSCQYPGNMEPISEQEAQDSLIIQGVMNS